MFSKCHQQVAHLWICALILSFFLFLHFFIYTHIIFHLSDSFSLVCLPHSMFFLFLFLFTCEIYVSQNFFYTLNKWIYVERILLRIMMKCKNEARGTRREKSFSFHLKFSLFLVNQRKIKRRWCKKEVRKLKMNERFEASLINLAFWASDCCCVKWRKSLMNDVRGILIQFYEYELRLLN
jgi:hypothetical protein